MGNVHAESNMVMEKKGKVNCMKKDSRNDYPNSKFKSRKSTEKTHLVFGGN